MASPPRFSWSDFGLTILGGAMGSALRIALIPIFSDGLAWIAVPVINIVGSFILGIVLGLAVRRGDTRGSRASRHFFGTGMMGGFTTYSAFAVLATDTQHFAAAATTVFLGLGAAIVGLWISRRRPVVAQ